MGVATVINTEYGYMATGGTDATYVVNATTTLRVMAISFSGNADNATCALTSVYASVDTSCGKFKSSDTGELNSAMGNFMFFGEKGAPFTGLKVNLSNTGDHIYIYLGTK